MATARIDRDGAASSLWHAGLPDARSNANVPSKADVVVVGGGLSGLWIALALAEADRPPLVLERRHIAAGASGRNGGLLLPGTSELYADLAARHGRQAARLLWRWALDGAADLVAAIEGCGIDCDWRPEGALHAAWSEPEAEQLIECARLLAEDGFPGAWLDRRQLEPWLDVPLPEPVHGALHLPDGGAFHSGRLVAGLADAASRRGATLVEGVDVRGVAVSSGGRDLRVETDRGPVRARAVVVATNAWLSELLPDLAAACVPVRGQVLSTAPLPRRVVRGAWSLNAGYEYLQQLSDGRIVLGGMRWAAPDREVGHLEPEIRSEIQDRLELWLRDSLPALDPTVERRWAGPMCWTADRLPLVGAVPPRAQASSRSPAGDRPAPAPAPAASTRARANAKARAEGAGAGHEGVWVAAAYSGHGVPIAPAAARLIAAALTGAPSGAEVAKLVDPSRPLTPMASAAVP